MKKLLIAVCFMLGFAGLASAQEAAKKKVSAKVVKMEKAKPAATAAPVADAAGPKKADGSLDKRYKANKTKLSAGPLKADGTPDKRFKTNKKKPE